VRTGRPENYLRANARGDGLILDGSAGDVLVRKPAFYAKHEFDDGTDLARWWVSARPRQDSGCIPITTCARRGARPYMFSGAYESYGLMYGGQFRLGSASGNSP